MGLDIRGLGVRYGDLRAVDDVDLSVATGESVVVLGPSGCGKSTLLRAVAGLVTPETGSILIDGQRVDDRRPDQRGVGLMFQDHALFPHRTVAQNVAFGPRMQGMPRDEIERRVAEVLALVHLEGFGDRRATELSGGEQQRVALARALAPRPRVLLLDEPLGALDRALRARLLDELAALLGTLSTTVLYVTHDQDEALRLADRVAVMRLGRLVQVAPPERLWRDPVDEFVARFVGLEQIFEVDAADGGLRTPLGMHPVPPPDLETPGLRLVLLADALRVLRPELPPTEDETVLAATIVDRHVAADHLRVEARVDAGPTVLVPVWRGVGPAVRDRVELALDWSATRLVPADPDGGVSRPSPRP